MGAPQKGPPSWIRPFHRPSLICLSSKGFQLTAHRHKLDNVTTGIQFCPFRVFSCAPIGHDMNLAIWERHYNVLKYADTVVITALENGYRGEYRLTVLRNITTVRLANVVAPVGVRVPAVAATIMDIGVTPPPHIRWPNSPNRT